MRIWAARRVLADMSWQRAMEMEMDRREEVLGQGARWQSSSPASFDSSMGAK
jgi:hypothetical protein